MRIRLFIVCTLIGFLFGGVLLLARTDERCSWHTFQATQDLLSLDIYCSDGISSLQISVDGKQFAEAELRG